MPDPSTCSHDAPDQKPGSACIRCGKILPGVNTIPAPPLTSHTPLPKEKVKETVDIE